jgi:hypothetical protein
MTNLKIINDIHRFIFGVDKMQRNFDWELSVSISGYSKWGAQYIHNVIRTIVGMQIEANSFDK